MVNEPTTTISCLAQVSLNELFDADRDAEHEYNIWLDEREHESDRISE
jgi:hypothetical protein|tara:strand:+ start:431 stop:574 length:144 start_codon:yes stop_codon:yes gene_type:complete